MGGAAISKNLGVMDGQILGVGEGANPSKLMVSCKSGSPTAGYNIGYKIGEWVCHHFFTINVLLLMSQIIAKCPNTAPHMWPFSRGSFAVVRVATHNKTKVKYAVKEVYTGDLSAEQLADLDKEMCVLSQLRHNNICSLQEVYKSPNHVYMVSALVLNFMSVSLILFAAHEIYCLFIT